MGTQHTYRVADLFCGAGGASSGAARAIRRIGAQMELVAVNHWDLAIATHSRNHPGAKHYCVNLDAARPEDIVPEGQLDLLMASPECVFHSRARGGRPINDQRRMSAWHVQRWCSALDVRCVLVENVPEFVAWAPLLPNGRPDPAKKGLYFQSWVQALWGMGYVVEWRMLNAADFGDATTRTRFFLQARKDGVPIRWPEPSHAAGGPDAMFGGRLRWRSAREVIDWDNPGGSLLTRKRPLSVKTRKRIAKGLARYGGALAQAYIDLLDLPVDETPTVEGGEEAPSAFVSTFRNHTRERGPDDPLPTITAANGSGGMSIVTPVAEPFILPQQSDGAPRDIDQPAPTIVTIARIGLVEPVAEPFVLGQQSCSAARGAGEPIPTVATAGAIALIEPTLIPYYGTGVAQPVDAPVPTVTTRARFALCEPTLVHYYGKSSAGSVDDPVPTVTGQRKFALCEPIVVPYGPRADARDVDQPLPTVMTRDRLAVATPTAEPFLVPQFGEREGQSPRVHAVDQPLPAVTSHGAGALVEPVIVQAKMTHQGGLGVRPVDEPLYTVLADTRLGLVQPMATEVDPGCAVDGRRVVWIDGVPHLLDIRFRMLNNRELARAMSFDDLEDGEYHFTGNIGEVTKQIGNAIPVRVAEALVLAMLGGEE